MYYSIIVSFLLISPLITFRVNSQDVRDKTICLRPYMQTVTGYEDNLEKGQVDLREKNEYVYRYIPFKKPTVVLGWQISGKDGMLLGTGNERRGLVTEYKIKCLTRMGDWVFINNSKSGTEVFKSLGNLAQPDTITKIDLANPITTLSLRLYPQLWEGVPFFKLKLKLCEPEYMDAPSMKANATITNSDSRIIRTPKRNVENPKVSIIRNREADIRLSKKLKHLFHTPADPHTNSKNNRKSMVNENTNHLIASRFNSHKNHNSKDHTSSYKHRNQFRRNQYHHGSPNMDIDRTLDLDTLRPIYGYTSNTDDKPFKDRKHRDSGPTSSYLKKKPTFLNGNQHTHGKENRHLPIRYYDKRKHKRDRIDDRPSNDNLKSRINNEFVPDKSHKKNFDQYKEHRHKHKKYHSRSNYNRDNDKEEKKSFENIFKKDKNTDSYKENRYKHKKKYGKRHHKATKNTLINMIDQQSKSDKQTQIKLNKQKKQSDAERPIKTKQNMTNVVITEGNKQLKIEEQIRKLRKENQRLQEHSLREKKRRLEEYKLKREEEIIKQHKRVRELNLKFKKLQSECDRKRKQKWCIVHTRNVWAKSRCIRRSYKAYRQCNEKLRKLRSRKFNKEYSNSNRTLRYLKRKHKKEEEKEERTRKLRVEERKRKLEEKIRKLREDARRQQEHQLREEERKRKRKLEEEARERKLEEEERKRKLETKRKIAEEKRRLKEHKLREEERKRELEAKRKIAEEERRLQERKRKLREEELKRKLEEEERKRKREIEEEKRKLREEERRRQENKLKEEERKRKLREEERKRKLEEEERKRKLQEEARKRKIEEEKRKLREKERRRQENKLKEEERKRKLREEERKRKQREEELKRQKHKIREEERKRKFREEERKRKLEEEERKRKLQEKARKRKLEEEKRKLREEERKRKIREEKLKQHKFEEEKRKRKLKEKERRQQEHKLREEERKRKFREEERKIKLREEERKRQKHKLEEEQRHKALSQLNTVLVPNITVQTRTTTEPTTTPSITIRQRTTNTSQPTTTTSQPTTTANLTKDTLNEDLKKELLKETKALICKTKPKWRYSSTGIPPSDVFTATGDSSQAWRANGGLTVEPYRFHTNTRNNHKQTKKKIFFQVSFPDLTEVFGLRIVGSSLPHNWGCITRFALLYKMAHQMEWVFYRDNFGAARVFDMGQQSKNSCSKPMTFRLPVPLRTTDIRIYPDQWSGEPLLHVNFLTCSLEGQTCVEPLLTGGGKLQRLQFDNMDEQLVDKNSMFYITIKFKKHAISRIKAVQFSQGPKDNSITKFVLQYLGNSEKWNSVSDKDGEIMMFSTDTIVKKSYPTTVFFSKPVIAKSMRIYPETWQGLSPMIKIEFLGCTLKH